MVQYYLPKDSNYSTLSIESITIYKEINKNKTFDNELTYLDRYVKSNTICLQQIELSGKVKTDELPTIVEESKDITTSNEVKPKVKRGKKKDA